MSALDGLLDQIKNAITDHATENKSDAGNLLSRVTDLFGRHAQTSGAQNVRPASQDPYGDPGNGGAGKVKPASQDPYGDPADQK